MILTSYAPPPFGQVVTEGNPAPVPLGNPKMTLDNFTTHATRFYTGSAVELMRAYCPPFGAGVCNGVAV